MKLSKTHTPHANREGLKCEIERINPRNALTDAKLLSMIQRALEILHPAERIDARLNGWRPVE